ncbi:MAG: alanine--glyoxylate aminotransferase family protein [Rhodobacteraceae bacterium]|nr:alanine--glyoxylate aminotransferase family protein [Paracoccaceae bacterium]
MTLSYGRQYLAIPGPSVVPDRVLNAMHKAAPNIYEGALVDMVPGMIEDLKNVARTRANAAIYIGNGHAAWEAALANVVAPGDKILALTNGVFGHGWAEIARNLGADVEVFEFGKQAPVDLARLAQVLSADKGSKIKAVTAVHVDTSTGIRNDIAALRRVMDEVGHPALLMVDCIASLGCDVFEMDAWGVDVMVAASQKGLMTPPGLGLVFFSHKAGKVRDRMARVGSYWDWRPRARPEHFYQYFGGTAPTHHLMGLRAALDMIAEEGGIQAVWARHEVLARAIWAACDAWGNGGSLAFNVADAAHRNNAVTALRLKSPLATELRRWCEAKAGVTLGIGLGMAAPDDPAWHGYFRIGHMGHVNAHMVLGMLGVIEAGMKALGIAYGAGALEAAAAVIAEA